MTPAQEDRAVAALVALASKLPREERADFRPRAESDPDDPDAEGLAVAADHGIDPARLTALRSLARSRGLNLEQVLRAAMRGELRDVVELPEPRS